MNLEMCNYLKLALLENVSKTAKMEIVYIMRRVISLEIIFWTF